MAPADDRRLDIWDILDRITVGWIAPPTKPNIVVEDRRNTFASVFGDKPRNIPTNGIFFIKKEYTYNRDKIARLHENVVWEFPCTIIISSSFVLLQGVFDQTREVFDRYTNAPWSTSTRGTSTTYDEAQIDTGNVSPRHPYYVMDVTVFLKETVRNVTIA